jgi:hypothetical protein
MISTSDIVGSQVAQPRYLHKFRVDRWLSLAAAPTFAGMALLTGLVGAPDALCSMAGASAIGGIGGMVPMYLLMSAFHLAPWLKLISGRRSR